MSKKTRKNMEKVKLKKSYKVKMQSHTGNQGLVPSLFDENVMVTKKVRKAQGERK